LYDTIGTAQSSTRSASMTRPDARVDASGARPRKNAITAGRVDVTQNANALEQAFLDCTGKIC